MTERFAGPCILIDRTACYNSPHKIRFAILHECSRYIEIDTCIRFQTYLQEISFDMDVTDLHGEDYDRKCKGLIEWVEWQADTLGARLQMPRECFLSALLELVTSFRERNRSIRMWDIITGLMKRFYTSRSCRERRLKELGFSDEESICRYADSFRIGGEESPGKNSSCYDDYDIKDCELQHVFLNREFQAALRSGRYLYVRESFLPE